MPPRFLIDTDLLVDHLRGNDRAAKFLGDLAGDLLISSITVAELYAGVRGVDEERVLDQFLQAFQVVEVDQQIAKRAGLYRHEYTKSHGTGLADALIAATAEARHAVLISLNRRHFPMAKGMIVPYS